MTLYFCDMCRVVRAYSVGECFNSNCSSCGEGNLKSIDLEVHSLRLLNPPSPPLTYKESVSIAPTSSDTEEKRRVIYNTLELLFENPKVDDITIRRNRSGIYRLYVNGAVSSQGQATIYSLFKPLFDSPPDIHGRVDLDFTE